MRSLWLCCTVERNGERTPVTSLHGVPFSVPKMPQERLRVASSKRGPGACSLGMDWSSHHASPHVTTFIQF